MTDPHPTPFYFAIPCGATLESRRNVPQHIAATFGVKGRIEHVRSELAFSLYRIVDS